MNNTLSEEDGIGGDTLLVAWSAHYTGIEQRVAGGESGDAFGAGEADDGVGVRVVVTLLAAHRTAAHRTAGKATAAKSTAATLTLILIATLLAG